MSIHPTAIIDKNARLAGDITIGPGCVIEQDVEIASGAVLHNYVIIHSGTRIGKNNTFHSFTSIGGAPQDIKHNPKKTTGVEIGNNNTFHEYLSVHRGSSHANGITKIGNNNFLMSYVHIAHDCQVGDNNILANCVNLAGHVILGSNSVIGGIAAVHQQVSIGSGCMIAAGVMVRRNIPSYILVAGEGEKAKAVSINRIGLKKIGMSGQQIKNLGQAFKLLFKLGPLEQKIQNIRQQCLPGKEIDEFIHSVEHTPHRGIISRVNRKTE